VLNTLSGPNSWETDTGKKEFNKLTVFDRVTTDLGLAVDVAATLQQ